MVFKVPTAAFLKEGSYQSNFIISVFKCADDDILDQGGGHDISRGLGSGGSLFG